MKHIIVTGGIGAGKTNLINNIASVGHWVIGSPATTMKRKLAQVIARTVNTNGSDEGWQFYFEEMLDRHHKEKYRSILQGYGEHFSNLDPFFWIQRTMNEVQQEIDNVRWSNDFDFITGTLYDSIRRPQEIIGIRQVFPDAIHVRLEVSPERQMDFLVNHLGHSVQKAIDTLAHSSEHWLDDMKDQPYDADFTIDANRDADVIYRDVLRALEL